MIVATHMPMLDRGLYFARVHPERSYVLAARIRGKLPAAMYLSTEKPAHSIRAHPVEDGHVLLIGGESHKTGQSETSERYRALERWAREHFDVERFDYHWATQDNMPADGMPFIGKLWPFSSRLHTATGFRKWGLALGTAAAMMLTDAAGGRENPWAETFDPMRLELRASAGELVKENADVAMRFFGDRLKRSSQPASRPARAGSSGTVSARQPRTATTKAGSTSCPRAARTSVASWRGTRPSGPGTAPVTARGSTTGGR